MRGNSGRARETCARPIRIYRGWRRRALQAADARTREPNGWLSEKLGNFEEISRASSSSFFLLGCTRKLRWTRECPMPASRSFVLHFYRFSPCSTQLFLSLSRSAKRAVNNVCCVVASHFRVLFPLCMRNFAVRQRKELLCGLRAT